MRRPHVKPQVRDNRYTTESFYGLYLTYRFSYPTGKSPRVVLHVGIRNVFLPEKKLFKRSISAYVKGANQPPVKSLKELPTVVMRQVCEYLLPILRKRDPHTDYYPLGFMLEAHANEIVSRPTKRGRETSDSTKADKEAAIRKLQEEEGNTRWGDVTPEHCRTWLSSCSVHRQNQCAAVMRALHEIERSISTETVGRQSCYHIAYLISNIPLEAQYKNVQIDEPATWKAFLRRIHHVVEYTAEGCNSVTSEEAEEPHQQTFTELTDSDGELPF